MGGWQTVLTRCLPTFKLNEFSQEVCPRLKLNVSTRPTPQPCMSVFMMRGIRENANVKTIIDIKELIHGRRISNYQETTTVTVHVFCLNFAKLSNNPLR